MGRFLFSLKRIAGFGGSFFFALGILVASKILERFCHPPKRPSEIRKVDERQNQARNPEDMIVREKRQQTQNCHDLELEFLALVSHTFRQRVQSQKQKKKCNHDCEQEYRHDDKKPICLTRRGYETWQDMRRNWIEICGHWYLLPEMATD
jgi:hypothetical protein